MPKNIEKLEDEILENLASSTITAGGLKIDKQTLKNALKKGAKYAGYTTGAIALIFLSFGGYEIFCNRKAIKQKIKNFMEDKTIGHENAEDVVYDFDKDLGI